VNRPYGDLFAIDVILSHFVRERCATNVRGLCGNDVWSSDPDEAAGRAVAFGDG
jgi:hypothetical protein